MNKPLFSVPMLTYNHADYIVEALDSIISQEHSYPYEIIIGDDCSSDNTRQILLDYQKKYPDIIILLLNEKNLGLIKNYFNVIKHCSGTYIMDCSGDDYWLPGKIVAQIPFMEAHPDIGLCYGLAKQYDQDRNRFITELTGEASCAFEYLLNESINPIPPLTICFRGEKLFQYIKEMKPETKENWLMEDLPELLWFAKNSKIHFFNQIFAVYRIISGSISHTKDIEKKIAFIDSEIDIRSFFSQKYGVHFRIEDFENKKFIEYMLYALQTKNYTLFQDAVKNMRGSGIKTKLKKLAGKSYLLFLLFYYIRNLKGL
jgi:glycosyltransferase involved in cell wall biosynthesis